MHLHALTSTCKLQALTSTCTHLQALARTYAHLHALGSTCTHLHALARTYTHLQALTRTCTTVNKETISGKQPIVINQADVWISIRRVKINPTCENQTQHRHDLSTQRLRGQKTSCELDVLHLGSWNIWMGSDCSTSKSNPSTNRRKLSIQTDSAEGCYKHFTACKAL